MKKKIILALVLSLILTLLAGCNSGYVPYDYDLEKYIKLGDYSGLSYDFVNIGVSDDQLQQAVWEDMRANGYGEAEKFTSGSVLPGDVLILDFTGEIDGKEDATLAATGVELEIGSDTFLESFENGLIGQSIGKRFDLEVTFPAVYIKSDYAGKTVTYSVYIHSATRMVCPELTDPIVVDISDQSNVASYLEAKRDELEKNAAVQADIDVENALWQQVLAGAQVIEYPKKAMKFLSEQTQKEFEDEAEKNNQTLKEYLTANEISTDDFSLFVTARAQELCKEEMVLHAIARKENIKASSKEVKELSETYMDTYGYKSLKELYAVHSKGLVEQSLLYQKVKDFVVENAKQIV